MMNKFLKDNPRTLPLTAIILVALGRFLSGDAQALPDAVRGIVGALSSDNALTVGLISAAALGPKSGG